MVGIDGPALLVASDDVASRLFLLDEGVMMRGAKALVVLRVDEQRPVALMRPAMVHDRGGCDPAHLLAALA